MESLVEGDVTALKLEGKNEIFSITGGEFVTMKQIVEYLKELIGNVRAEYALPRSRDYKGTMVSIEKVKRKLNRGSKYTFRRGL